MIQSICHFGDVKAILYYLFTHKKVELHPCTEFEMVLAYNATTQKSTFFPQSFFYAAKKVHQRKTSGKIVYAAC